MSFFDHRLSVAHLVAWSEQCEDGRMKKIRSLVALNICPRDFCNTRSFWRDNK